MSGDAKRFRASHGSGGRHGEAFWQEEKDNVGLKLLKGMGWSQGTGLGKDGQGRVEAVKQRRKQDNAGIGSTANTRDEAFRASQDLFNDVLARLSGKAGADDDEASAGTKSLGSAATTISGAMASRNMSRRFCRSKGYLSSVQGEGGMNGIIVQQKAAADEAKGTDGTDAEARNNRSTSSVSVADYFAKRRRELGLAEPESGASRGFSLEDQTMFAESQVAMAYGGGKRGLGCGGAADDDDDRLQAKWAPAAKPAAVPPPSVVPLPKAPPKAAAAFNWKKAIKAELRAAPKGELRLKRLRKAVLAEHARQPTHAAPVEARRLFKKRLKKTSGVVLSGKLVRLAPA